ncbi:MAG TPA: hypothetical protein VGB85_18355 [Nannocystis sp.]
MRGLVAILALASACDRVAYGSSADVADILAAHGVTAPSLVCRNPAYEDGAIVRAVACTTTLTPAEVETLRATVPLAPGTPRSSAPVHNCATRIAARAEVLVGANTRVANGVGPIALYHDRTSGEACVEITYPWSE